MPADCGATRLALARVDSADELATPARSHLVTCLRCQADAAQYRRLRRVLRELEMWPVPGEARVLAGILAALDACDARLARRAAYAARAAIVVGGLVAATAGAAGALALVRRRPRLPLAG